MADHLAASGHVVPDQDLGALEAASRALGWDGDVLLELTLLGCRVVPVTYLREDVHPGPRVAMTGTFTGSDCSATAC